MQSIIGDKYIYESTEYIDWSKHRSMEKVSKKQPEAKKDKKQETPAPVPLCQGKAECPLIPILQQCTHLRQVLERLA